MKHRLVQFIFTGFFCLFYYHQVLAVENPASPRLRPQIIDAVQTLIDHNILQGSLISSDSTWQDEVSIPLDRNQPSVLIGKLFFSADSVNGKLSFSFFNDNIDLALNSFIDDDNLSGTINMSGNNVQAQISIYSVRDFEGDFDLNAEVNIDRLSLIGPLSNLKNGKNSLLHQLKYLSSLFQFEDLNIKITGDSSLIYTGMELQCQASIDMQIHNPGFRQGQITLQQGSLWKYGKKFQLSYGYYDFASGESYAYGLYRTHTMLPAEESGLVRQEYLITLEYQSSPDDSAHWQFSSIPPLPQPEIINLLVRGSPDTPEISSPIPDNLEDRVKLAVTDYRSDRYTRYAERQVGRLIAFDRVVIEGNVFNSGSVLRASKGLGGKIELSVRGAVGAGAQQTVSFQYPLSERFFLVNETNHIGNTGIDLRYILKYK